MKTREKILLISTTLSLLLLLTLTFVAFSLEKSSLNSFSIKYGKEKSNAFQKIFHSELAGLEILCTDWAFWDDTYEFMEDRNERYIASNLVESMFKDAKINVMVFVDKHGEVVFSKFYDENWNEKELPEIFLSPEIQGKTGFLKLDGKIFLISSKPILPSTPTSEESRGYLLMGRILDESWFDDVSEVLNAKIFIDVEREALENKTIAKIELRDVLGQDTIFVIESENPYYGEYTRIVKFYFLSFLCITLAFLAFTIFFLDREITSKILKLERFVRSAKPGEKIEVGGTEEIRTLSNAINELLSRIARYEEDVKFLMKMLRHDILNVLTVVKGFIELYETHGNPEYLKRASLQLEKGVELLRLTKELENSELEKIRIAEVVENIKKSFPIEIELSGDAEILADKGIFSVFNNLMENSMKHGKASKVSIEVKKDDKIRILFRDNGIGFSDIAMKKVFREIYTEGGTGLGLYIVKKFVEKYGGEIKLLDRNTVEIALPSSEN